MPYRACCVTASSLRAHEEKRCCSRGLGRCDIYHIPVRHFELCLQKRQSSWLYFPAALSQTLRQRLLLGHPGCVWDVNPSLSPLTLAWRERPASQRGAAFFRGICGLLRPAQPWGISVFLEHVYFTDNNTKTIKRQNKYTGDEEETITHKYPLHPPIDLRVVHPMRQPTAEGQPIILTDVGCDGQTGTCRTVCSHDTDTGMCHCSQGFTLSKHGDRCEGYQIHPDGKRCMATVASGGKVSPETVPLKSSTLSDEGVPSGSTLTPLFAAQEGLEQMVSDQNDCFSMQCEKNAQCLGAGDSATCQCLEGFREEGSLSGVTPHTYSSHVTHHTDSSGVALHTYSSHVTRHTDSSGVALHTYSSHVTHHNDSSEVTPHTYSSHVTHHTDSSRVALHTYSSHVTHHTDSSGVTLHTYSSHVTLHTDSSGVALRTYSSPEPIHTLAPASSASPPDVTTQWQNNMMERCPPSHDAYCLYEGVCFYFPEMESYGCKGHMGERCQYSDLEWKELQQAEQASRRCHLAIAVCIMVLFILLFLGMYIIICHSPLPTPKSLALISPPQSPVLLSPPQSTVLIPPTPKSPVLITPPQSPSTVLIITNTTEHCAHITNITEHCAYITTIEHCDYITNTTEHCAHITTIEHCDNITSTKENCAYITTTEHCAYITNTTEHCANITNITEHCAYITTIEHYVYIATTLHCAHITTTEHCAHITIIEHCAYITIIEHCAHIITTVHCTYITTIVHCANITTIEQCAHITNTTENCANITTTEHCAHITNTTEHCVHITSTTENCAYITTIEQCAHIIITTEHYVYINIIEHCAFNTTTEHCAHITNTTENCDYITTINHCAYITITTEHCAYITNTTEHCDNITTTEIVFSSTFFRKCPPSDDMSDTSTSEEDITTETSSTIAMTCVNVSPGETLVVAEMGTLLSDSRDMLSPFIQGSEEASRSPDHLRTINDLSLQDPHFNLNQHPNPNPDSNLNPHPNPDPDFVPHTQILNHIPPHTVAPTRTHTSAHIHTPTCTPTYTPSPHSCSTSEAKTPRTWEFLPIMSPPEMSCHRCPRRAYGASGWGAVSVTLRLRLFQSLAEAASGINFGALLLKSGDFLEVNRGSINKDVNVVTVRMTNDREMNGRGGMMQREWRQQTSVGRDSGKTPPPPSPACHCGAQVRPSIRPASTSTSLSLPLCDLLGLVDVGLEEELAEEHEVAKVHERGPDDVVHVGRALLALLQPGIHQVVHHAAHNHLGDLCKSDEHGELARYAEAGCPQCIVGVHDRVDKIVHGHEPATTSDHVLIGVPGVQQYCNVVVPVQEDQLLLSQHYEQSVT
ncbi:hypothetical protein JZ751_025589 [Albula glossodonta]|uniref:EGF-like domain-containing protein n=1 Tax=Albula glossodonta TaxID=121402 RepID=A0A8T2NDI1_9TELE|nr:hypothetical protein JZ751_025589 [Albula glossodonta]